jgi:hypothetical protein
MLQRMVGAATFQGAGNLSALAIKYKLAEAMFAGAGALSAYARLNMQVAATFEGAGNLSAEGTIPPPAGVQHSGEATFRGEGSLSAAQRMVAAATFNGAGNLSVNTQKSKQAGSNLRRRQQPLGLCQPEYADCGHLPGCQRSQRRRDYTGPMARPSCAAPVAFIANLCPNHSLVGGADWIALETSRTWS